MAEERPFFQDHKEKRLFHGSDRKKLFIHDQSDPLLSSPLSFQTHFTSHNTQAIRRPAGRPLVQPAPIDYHYSTSHSHQSLPLLGTRLQQGLGNLSLSRSRPCSEGSVPRKPVSVSNITISSQTLENLSLWSVHEDLLHEPMDISPDKALKASSSQTSPIEEEKCVNLALRRQGPAVSATAFRRLNSEEVKKSNWDNRLKYLEQKHTQTKQENPVGADKNNKQKQSTANADKVKGGRGWPGWCCIMILELLAGAGAVMASMFGMDMFGFWFQQGNTLNTTRLSQTLNDQVFGQHIAVQTIPSVLKEYLYQSPREARHPLVLSFHGSTGIGKNHVSLLISKQLHRGDMNKIISTLHFPHTHIDYTNKLESMVYPKLSSSRFNIFLIDEINKAPPSVIKALIGILINMRSREFLKNNYGVLFLLLSNTGASAINRHVLETCHMHKDSRELITHDSLVNILLEAQYHNGDNFDWFTQLHNKGLIDVIIPFLPLERKHVERCAMVDMQAKGIYASHAMIQNVLNEMKFVPPENPIFSASGCRKVPTKVDVTAN